jgi:hypothetical protein
MPKTPVVLRWYNDDALYATIDGLVESCEDSPFTQDPEAVASIICFKPNFTMPAVQVAGNTVSTATEQTVTSGGTVESGYVFTLNINRTLDAFSLFNRRPNGDMAQLDVTYNFLAGDVVKISTQPNNKYITLTRAGVTSSILYAVTAGGKWGPLWPGANYIRALATGAAIPFTIDYIPLLGGL